MSRHLGKVVDRLLVNDNCKAPLPCKDDMAEWRMYRVGYTYVLQGRSLMSWDRRGPRESQNGSGGPHTYSITIL